MAERKIKPKPTTTKQYRQRQRQLSQQAGEQCFFISSWQTVHIQMTVVA